MTHGVGRPRRSPREKGLEGTASLQHARYWRKLPKNALSGALSGCLSRAFSPCFLGLVRVPWGLLVAGEKKETPVGVVIGGLLPLYIAQETATFGPLPGQSKGS